MTQQAEDDILAQRATVVEQPFSSSKPIFGSLIVWLRTMWNNVATKWFVRPLIQQQNEFNQELVRQLRHAEAKLLEQDQQTTALTHQVAELSTEIVALRRQLMEKRSSNDTDAGEPQR